MVKGRNRPQAAPIVVAVAAAALLGGCSSVRDAVGLNKDAPDEFQVVSRAPLALPPNYDLRPPEPGAERPQEGSVTDAAAARILGRRSTTASGGAAAASSGPQPGPAVQAAPRAPVTVSSTGVAALRDQLRLDQAEPNIRQVVNRETANFDYGDQYPIDALLFWKADPQPGERELVDAQSESKRLRENAALGRPADEGDTPIIQRKRGGIFSGIF